jgi:peptidoglycan hydrolase-like protein with peptidoglycan-binding domain
LKVDGIVGPETQAALAKTPAPKTVPVVPAPPPGAVEVVKPAPAPSKKRGTVRVGSRGPDVVDLQQMLTDLAGATAIKAFDPKGTDGIFGPNTQAAVKAFQRSEGLAVDGIVGPKTWAALEQGGNTARVSGDRRAVRRASAGAVTRMLYASGPHGPAKDVGVLRRYKREAGVLTPGNLYDVPTARSLVARGIVPPTPFEFSSHDERKRYAAELRWRAARDPARREEWSQALSALE